MLILGNKLFLCFKKCYPTTSWYGFINKIYIKRCCARIGVGKTHPGYSGGNRPCVSWMPLDLPVTYIQTADGSSWGNANRSVWDRYGSLHCCKTQRQTSRGPNPVLSIQVNPLFVALLSGLYLFIIWGSYKHQTLALNIIDKAIRIYQNIIYKINEINHN